MMITISYTREPGPESKIEETSVRFLVNRSGAKVCLFSMSPSPQESGSILFLVRLSTSELGGVSFESV